MLLLLLLFSIQLPQMKRRKKKSINGGIFRCISILTAFLLLFLFFAIGELTGVVQEQQKKCSNLKGRCPLSFSLSLNFSFNGGALLLGCSFR